MGQARKKRLSARKIEPTADQIRLYMEKMADEHQQGWHEELTGATPPHWVYLLALHLRIVELDHLAVAAEELL
jgi:hypothetical protein